MFKLFREAKGRMQIGPLLDQAKYLLLHNSIFMTEVDWDDPYLYGYYSGSTFCLLSFGSQGRLRGESLGMVQAWGWNCLTNLPERLYLARVQMFAGGKSGEWAEGFDNGAFWAALLTGTANRKMQKVQEAIEDGRALDRLSRLAGINTPPNDFHDAAAVVFQRDWYGYISAKKRLAA